MATAAAAVWIGAANCTNSDDRYPPLHRQVTSGSGSGGGRGSGGSGPTVGACGDCATDADCHGTSCVELWAGGFRTCATSPEEATQCTGHPKDECCSSADCAKGDCFTLHSPYDAPGEAYNLCLADLCSSDADCDQFDVLYRCAPPNTFGFPMRHCIQRTCAQDEDCVERGAGCCAPVEDDCRRPDATTWWVLLECVYADGCRRNADCSQDEPPFDVGESFCDPLMASCSTILQGTLTCD